MRRFAWLSGLLLLQTLAMAQQTDAPAMGSTQSSDVSGIGYATVQEAFEALSADSAATQSFYQGWTIFNHKIDGKYIIWSFTPEDHPVHPSAVRREVVSRDGQINISMGILCYSSRLDCDQLVAQYEQINENLKRRLSANADP